MLIRGVLGHLSAIFEYLFILKILWKEDGTTDGGQ